MLIHLVESPVARQPQDRKEMMWFILAAVVMLGERMVKYHGAGVSLRAIYPMRMSHRRHKGSGKAKVIGP